MVNPPLGGRFRSSGPYYGKIATKDGGKEGVGKTIFSMESVPDP